MGDVKAEFKERYELATIPRLERSSELWRRNQKPDEKVLDYIDFIMYRGKELGMDDSELRKIILKGMRTTIRSYVLQEDHDTLDQIKKRARKAEQGISSLTEEERKMIMDPLMKSLENLEIGASVNAVDPMQLERHYQNASWEQPEEYPEENEMGEAMDYQESGWEPAYEDTGMFDPADTPEFLPECSGCGFDYYPGHQCPAQGQICWFCGGPDHFERVCRKCRVSPSQSEQD